MDKQRVMPVLACAVLAVSLTACQGMMGGSDSSKQTSSAPAAASTGQQAMSNDLVRDVQRGLASRGYDVGPQDGVYGAGTEQALRRFQQDQRMTASGQVDAQTLAALGVMGGPQRAAAPSRDTGSRDYVPTSRRQGASAAPSGGARVGLNQDQVRSVQQNLADRGYDPGQVDGRWGKRTQGALTAFQRDQNMRTNGRPDPQTLAALGVESGSPATQTGQMPSENARRRGELPPTGSQAPGSAPEQERAPITPGGAPDTANPPD